MEVTSLYTNIPQEEGIETVCKAYDKFYKKDTPIPTHILREMIRLVLQENSFQFNGSDYLQTHGTAMGTKMAVALQIFLCPRLKTISLKRAKANHLCGKDILTMYFLCGTPRERTLTYLSWKLTGTILQLNSRLTYHRKKYTF